MLQKILKYKFWILAGLAVIPPIVVYFLVVRPLVAENIQNQNKFKGRIEKLESIAKKKELWNQSYITAIEERIKVLAEEETKARNVLLTWQQPLDLMLTKPDGKEITDAGEWGPRYEAECRAVDAEFLRTGIEKPGEKSLFEYKSFPNRLPTPEERLWATRDVVLYRHFTEMLLRANDEGKKRRILRILGLQFTDKVDDVYLPPGFVTNFSAKGFSMSILLQYVNLPDVLKAFVTSPNLIVVIDTVNVSRATGQVGDIKKSSGRSGGQAGAGGEPAQEESGGEEFDDLVKVEIFAHIVKYTPGGPAVAVSAPGVVRVAQPQAPAPGQRPGGARPAPARQRTFRMGRPGGGDD